MIDSKDSQNYMVQFRQYKEDEFVQILILYWLCYELFYC